MKAKPQTYQICKSHIGFHPRYTVHKIESVPEFQIPERFELVVRKDEFGTEFIDKIYEFESFHDVMEALEARLEKIIFPRI